MPFTVVEIETGVILSQHKIEDKAIESQKDWLDVGIKTIIITNIEWLKT